MDPHDPTIDVACESVQPAIEGLILGNAPLQQRLVEAWTDHLSRLVGIALHPNLQEKFDGIYGMVNREDLAIDGIERLTEQQIRLLAFRILEFSRDLEQLLGARD